MAFLILALLLPLQVAGAQAQFDGEYGLWVTDSGGEVGVGWLTAGAQEGVLEVFSGGRSLYRTETPRGQAHFASFARPSGDSVLLRYGGVLNEDLYSTVVYLGESTDRVPEVLSGVDSLYLVGDVHGEYDRLLLLLGNAGLVDAQGEWTGGQRHVAFLGDIFDRGADVTRVLWFLYELERQAQAAGGGAHLVLGNHETMVFTGDLRYVHGKEEVIAGLHGVSYSELFDIRNSVLGRWLVGRPALMKVNDVLLAHGGVAPDSRPRSVEEVNDSLRAFMSEDIFYEWDNPDVGLFTDAATARQLADQYETVIVIDQAAYERRMGMFFDESSILWFRGYVQSDTLAAALDDVLEEFGAGIHAVAHTALTTIEARYGGKLLAVDLQRAATELLLLAWEEPGRYQRWRIRLEGPPEQF